MVRGPRHLPRRGPIPCPYSPECVEVELPEGRNYKQGSSNSKYMTWGDTSMTFGGCARLASGASCPVLVNTRPTWANVGRRRRSAWEKPRFGGRAEEHQ